MVRTYAILPWEPSPEQWAVVMETPERHRKSLDGTQVVVKWEGPTPAPLAGVETLTYPEALELMNTPAWSEQEPDP